MIRLIFSRRWLFATVLVLAAIAVMARLGIWQLDRLEKRRAFNARVEEQQNETLLQLEPLQLEADFYNMEYRRVSAMGTYLPEEEIILRNQSWEGELGFQLFTPLLIEGSQKAILVQRGWIPGDKSSETARQAFREEGIVEVHGVLRRAETDFGLQFRPDPTLTAGEDRLDAWNNLSLEENSVTGELRNAARLFAAGADRKGK